MLGSTDLYVLAGVLSQDGDTMSLRELAGRLAVDHTLVHRSLKRAQTAGIYRAAEKEVHRANFEELVVHAARFIAPAQLGELTRGVPAAWAAQPMSGLIHQSASELGPVWPYALGEARGQALQPLHHAAVAAVQKPGAFAHTLAIIDSLRAGDVRVRRVAAGVLHDTLRLLPRRSSA